MKLRDWIAVERIGECSSLKDVIGLVLKYGVLAPSTHNTQPWLFKIEGNVLNIYYDQRISLPEADPIGRNLFISLGCLIENIFIASSYYKIFDDISFYNENNNNLVAQIKFKDFHSPIKLNLDGSSQLLASIPKRFTYRGLYRSEKISEELVKKVEKLGNSDIYVSCFTDDLIIKRLSMIIKNAVVKITSNQSFRIELAKWMRTNFTKKDDGMPGYCYDHSDLFSLFTPKLMTIVNPSRLMANKTYSSFLTSSLITIITTKNDSRAVWLDVGRKAEDVLLLLTSYGIGSTISVAAVDVPKCREELLEIVNRGKYLQFVCCSGYIPYDVRKSNRLLPKSKLLNS